MKLTNCLQKGREIFTEAKAHVRRYDKIYFLGLAVLLALGAAFYLESSLEDPYLVRYSNGRRIAAENLSSSPFEEIDPTPILRELAKKIGEKKNVHG